MLTPPPPPPIFCVSVKMVNYAWNSINYCSQIFVDRLSANMNAFKKKQLFVSFISLPFCFCDELYVVSYVPSLSWTNWQKLDFSFVGPLSFSFLSLFNICFEHTHTKFYTTFCAIMYLYIEFGIASLFNFKLGRFCANTPSVPACIFTAVSWCAPVVFSIISGLEATIYRALNIDKKDTILASTSNWEAYY